MDMTLYSLFKNKIANSPTEQVDNVGGYEIRFVNDIPEVREENYLYFVLGECQDGDKINVGGKGLTAIVYGDTMVDYGILNGNVFYDKYDFIRNVERRIFESKTGLLNCEHTKYLAMHKFDITGRMTSTGRGVAYLNGIHVYNNNLVEDGLEEYTIDINKYICGLPNGESDKLDLVSGKLYRNTEVCELNGEITWQNVAVYGGYRELRATGYIGNKPSFLNYDGTFVQSRYKTMDATTSYVASEGIQTSDFVITSKYDVEGKECIYISNSSIRIRIKEEKLTSTPYATALQQYLKNNPIKFCIQLAEPIVEDIEVPHPVMALEPRTIVQLIDSDKGIHPKVTLEAPVIKGSEQ